MSKASIHTAIDLCDLGLDYIEETETEFSIGAMTSLRSLELHPGLNAYCRGAVRDAVKDIVGVQFRNMATLGGSLFARFGFSDVLTVFLCMDSYVELYKGGVVPMSEFVGMKRDNDILVRLIVKKTAGSFAYLSMRNQRTDFPVVACAVSCLNGRYNAAVGARPSRAMLVSAEAGEDIIIEETARNFAEYAAKTIPTGSNVRASAAYRSHLIRVLVERCMMKLGGAQ